MATHEDAGRVEQTFAALERIEAEQRAAEAKALRDLAAYLGEAVVDLPTSSRVAPGFASASREFQRWGDNERSNATIGSLTVTTFSRDVRHGLVTPIEVAAAALRDAADYAREHRVAPTLRAFADNIERLES